MVRQIWAEKNAPRIRFLARERRRKNRIRIRNMDSTRYKIARMALSLCEELNLLDKIKQEISHEA
jgi:hypothetical protein